jgi:peptide/nickel transport system substrate-binding protein
MAVEVQALRTWVRKVATGEVKRRDFIRIMLGLGLSGPLIAEMLAAPRSSVMAQDPTAAPPTFTPTRRGGGGKLRLLYWQPPTILNAHFAVSAKDVAASRIVSEPLFSIAPDGHFVPILAAEIPSIENGGRSQDGTWTTWHLKQGVVWHDGRPFTADDVVFTWEFTSDPATGSVSRGLYENIRRIEKLDDHTVKVVFADPTPRWYISGGQILPQHLFAEYQGSNARHAPYNLKPVGTGPYRIVEFKPGDVARYEINPHYHMPNRPFFDTVELKGGGDAASAARAVIQTGEFDFAWNTQIEQDVRERLVRQGRKGAFRVFPGTSVEHIGLNRTDPWTEVDGERSSLKVPHPFFADLRVRQAYAAAVDRRTIAEHLYGAAGQATGNVLNTPEPFRSPNTHWAFDLDEAARLLEQAGWERGSDGIRR